MSLYEELYGILKENLLCNAPMKNNTTFKIGGEADFLAVPGSAAQLAEVLKVCRNMNIRHMIMGNGSNLLFSDRGYRGVVIKIGENLGETRISGDIFYAGGGLLLSRAAKAAAAAGLSGLEFASGIPGTVGGAVFMNAGAYGGEMADVVFETEYLNKNLEIVKTREHGFSYRNSIFQKNGGVVTGVWMKLCEGDCKVINEKIRELTAARCGKQPVERPSAGSAFKRPKGAYAAQLIDEAGLRGYTVGGAQVSTKHTGFIINTGNATAEDVRALMEYVEKTVNEKFNIKLEGEVRFVRENDE